MTPTALVYGHAAWASTRGCGSQDRPIAFRSCTVVALGLSSRMVCAARQCRVCVSCCLARTTAWPLPLSVSVLVVACWIMKAMPHHSSAKCSLCSLWLLELPCQQKASCSTLLDCSCTILLL